MTELNVWSLVVKCVCAAFCVFVVTIASCSMYDSHVKLEAIQSGADPLRMKCAVDGGVSSSPMCAIVAAQEPKK